MKECPFIDECDDQTSESIFKNYCRVRFGILFGYKDCHIYKRKLRVREGKPPYQTPREWKKELESKTE